MLFTPSLSSDVSSGAASGLRIQSVDAPLEFELNDLRGLQRIVLIEVISQDSIFIVYESENTANRDKKQVARF